MTSSHDARVDKCHTHPVLWRERLNADTGSQCSIKRVMESVFQNTEKKRFNEQSKEKMN